MALERRPRTFLNYLLSITGLSLIIWIIFAILFLCQIPDWVSVGFAIDMARHFCGILFLLSQVAMTLFPWRTSALLLSPVNS